MTAEHTAHRSDSAEDVAHPASWRIDSSYVNARGQKQDIPASAIETLTRALAYSNDTHSPPRRVVALRANGPRRVDVSGISGPLRWKLLLNERVVAAGKATEPLVDLPVNLEIGSYRLTIEADDQARSETLVLVAPDAAHEPPLFSEGKKVWLLAVQLYSLRSSHNWGHGDFTDLAQLLRIAAKTGAAGVGLNPLHALGPGQASPYSPSSRMFLNPLYIDVEAIPEFPGFETPGLAEEIALLRAANEIDYAAVYAVKLKGLKAAYEIFRNQGTTGRRVKFDNFYSGLGRSLQGFSVFEYLHERFNAPWQGWSEEWQGINDALTHINKDETEFHAFVQWIADEQLGACRDLARDLGLPVGLYLDVAVGVDAGGADAWTMPDAISPQLSIGAPPDVYNPAGQNWGLAALRPQALIDSDFDLYRQTLRSVMKYAGAIRIDHALGLNRLFYIPKGATAADGGYVSFPFDVMLAVTAQESVAMRCLVIGEDLGTIPEGVCETLNSWGVWSYRVAMFERDNEHTFRWPDLYPQKAIVTFNTHDLPTFAGWMTAHDIKTKIGLGLDPGETQSEREGAHHALRNTLSQQSMPPELDLISVLRYLARTRSQILAIQTEDILGLQDQPNIPGTIDEHPNWRRRLPITLDEFAGHETLHRIATVLAQEGRGFVKTN